ncbi:antibiotic biosynthesis monooxygenase [Agromyces atrinae]|uniref:putative quinol monooxygenase n=1 Tax=Agromyces atrinae TaxID=592376 RepID=UPI001F59A67E|nr:antibiotic biosynthesis monooxygenase [Agromyces atrinae]MCI2957070.1 antibiotic biosynthesis monooxygenase [Agromyces atrinae]
MSVVVTAIFVPRDGQKDDLVAAMRRGIEAVHGEDGCELYAIHDAEDGTITMIEKWTSREALAAHAEGDPVTLLNADIAELIAEPVRVTLMDAIPVGDAARGAL